MQVWVASGRAPERIIASKLDNPVAQYAAAPSKTLMSRPLCAWPRPARWKGSGSTDDATNFICIAPN